MKGGTTWKTTTTSTFLENIRNCLKSSTYLHDICAGIKLIIFLKSKYIVYLYVIYVRENICVCTYAAVCGMSCGS